MQEKVLSAAGKAANRVRKKFRHSTLNFIFIILFVNLFQKVFGMENSIVGIIFTIMMAASMMKDLTAEPVRHFIYQSLVLMAMGAAACAVNTLHPLPALLVNFFTIFLILYCFTYEYSSHLYFPYILSYLFLVFIGPITPEQLPKRELGMLFGAGCIILYQLVMGRKRAVETAHSALTAMIEEARKNVEGLLDGTGPADDVEAVRGNLCRLSRLVYDRRRSVLRISDASFSMVDSGRGLENLILLLWEWKDAVTEEHDRVLNAVLKQLDLFKNYMDRKSDMGEAPDRKEFILEGDTVSQELYDAVIYIRSHLVHMTDKEKREHYRPTVLSLSVRLKAALDVSPVRLVYALRVAVLLSAGTLLVQLLHLPHGKWLLFTVASVSLPYADDVSAKAKKRFAATAIGGVAGMALYALIPSPAGRTAIMMLSGYLSFYFEDYTGTFACSTVGALGGAVFMGAFGWTGVGSMLGIRLAYVIAGIIIAVLGNCLVFPFTRRRATEQLWNKYSGITDLLTKVCHAAEVDTQFYYSLVINAHLLEEKIFQNVPEASRSEMKDLLTACRQKVRAAHRHKLVGRTLQAE